MTMGSFTDPDSVATDAVLRRFNQVFLDHDPAALAELVAEDCVIENTHPAPDGARHEGRQACIALWTRIATMTGTHFETESIIARGDRGEIRWRLVWGPDAASSVRGVNLMRVRDGRIVEAQGYVKGVS
ncbi:nuclear transport factor 2 family protein [Taklimakanibacter lacteus]|uniref:nuclear transport factor 2 family protein n=1 Tax=Taklimakanibacter lacteus TaxID=2268456 RepID=UPI000E665676